MIKKVLYINLDSRTDRKEKIEKVLRNFSYERITAIQHKIGSIGCSMSHIYALEYAIKNNWDNVLIMEDDMEWNNFYINYPKLLTLMKNPYDVIVLGGILVSYNSETSELYKCNSTGAYLVGRHYYQTLLQNFKEGLGKLLYEINKPIKIRGVGQKNYLTIDTYWHKLQKRDNWFIIPLCYSLPGYSDVLKENVDWGSYFLK
jgi:hypothetical protein